MIMLQTLPLLEDRLSRSAGLRIAVLIPCYNEELAVAKVIEGFRDCLPDAAILVYDNNSSDRTRQVACDAGAVVRRETLQGKGHVVRRMFADIEADIYVLVDGDDTYDPAAAPAMVRSLIEHQLDMVTAVRLPTGHEAYRLGHRIGNRVLSYLVCHLFGNRVSDVLSGYRVFSRRFVKSFPAARGGFRDGDRVHHPRARTQDADRRGRDEVPRPQRGIALQAAYDLRRPAHPADHHDAGETATAAALVRDHRRGAAGRRSRAWYAGRAAVPAQRLRAAAALRAAGHGTGVGIVAVFRLRPRA